MYIASLVGATEKENIRGLSLYESTEPVNEWGGLSHGVSFAGGSDMVIAAHGFQGQPGDNRVVFSTTDFIGSKQRFVAPELTCKYAE